MSNPYGDAELADIYDLLYAAGRGKDYAAEAAFLVELVAERSPAARSLLDVACGTGGHLAHFPYPDRAGVELSPVMAERARRRLPEVPIREADMCTFELARTFDVVTCLFSAVGYLGSVGLLRAAVARMARHLAPGGVLLLEPWLLPEAWQPRNPGHDLISADGVTLARMSHSTTQGRYAHTEHHYLVGDSAGVRHFRQEHDLMLFTLEEYLEAFARAGLSAEFRPDAPPGGRGLFIASGASRV